MLISRGRGVQGLAHNERSRRSGIDRGATTLPICPAAGMCLARSVGEDHFCCAGVLDCTTECEVLLGPVRVPNLEVLSHLSQIEDCDRCGISERNGVAQIDQWVDAREGAVLLEPPEQRLRCAAVLGRLQSHSGEGPSPGLNFVELGLAATDQTLGRSSAESLDLRVNVRLGGNAGNYSSTRHEVRECSPDV